MACDVCTEHHLWSHNASEMRAQRVVSGFILRCDVCTRHHQWNHITMRCMHRTSSVDSYYNAMCAHVIISGIILRCDACTEHH